MSPSNLVRWGGFAAMMAGLLYFVGYAGMAELLLPMMSNLGGHVVLGLAGLTTLLALVGVLAKDAGRSARLGTAGYALSFVGAAVFYSGNLAEGIWFAEFGTGLFAIGMISLLLGVVLLGFSMLRGKALAPWSVWTLVVGWVAFLPIANSPVVFGHTFLLSLLAAGVWGVGWVSVGYTLRLGQGEMDRRPSRVR